MERFSNMHQLIAEVQKRPALWDTSCHEYGNKDIRKQCWAEISDIFTGNEAMTPTEKKMLTMELQRKWKNIRTCYARELKRQKKLQVSGHHMDDRKSEYLYYRQLQFLQKGRDTDSPETIEFLEENILDEEPPPRKVMKLETVHDLDPFQTVYTEQRSMDHGSATSEANEDKLFLMSLVSTLNGLPARKKMAVKIKILSLLHEATEYDE